MRAADRNVEVEVEVEMGKGRGAGRQPLEQPASVLKRDPKGIRWKKGWKRSAGDPARPGRAQEWRKQRNCLF